MKKVINGRSYNTETAKELGYQTNGYANNDFYFTGETLYRKKTGEFFLYGEGGAYSIYGRDFGMSRGSGKKSSLFQKMKQKIGQKNIWMQRNTLRFLAEMKSFLRYSLRLRNLHNSLVLMKTNITVSQSIFNLKRY